MNIVPAKHSSYIADLGDGLFLGGRQSTRKSIIKDLGINQVFFITINPHPLVSRVGYHSVEVDDNAPSASKLFDMVIPDILPKIHQLLKDGQRVLVCCFAGKSRSVTIVTAYLIRYRGMTMDSALEYILERRPVINPNPTFRRKLMEFH